MGRILWLMFYFFSCLRYFVFVFVKNFIMVYLFVMYCIIFGVMMVEMVFFKIRWVLEDLFRFMDWEVKVFLDMMDGLMSEDKWVWVWIEV